MNVTLTIDDKKYTVKKGTLLCDALESAGYKLHLGCGKCGRCGKCAVECGGAFLPMSYDEAKILKGKSNMRLACRAVIDGDCKVVMPKSKTASKIESLNGFDISPTDRSGIGYAVDIGTTTVVAIGYDLGSGKQISRCTAVNPQRQFGDDVITRIQYCKEHGVSKLHEMITELVDDMTSAASSRVIVGNTAMMLIYAANDPSSLGHAPYYSPEYFGKRKGNDYYPKCIHGFAGSDLTAAMLACDVMSGGPVMLCDIGTNCEIALFDGKKLAVCSAAAGPCFEGYGIKNGMSASSGAICSVRCGKTKELEYDVIGGGDPIGFCGSGLIDAVACLLKRGDISSEGHMETGVYIGGVEITPADVRAVQLAKAAVISGITVLTKYLNMTFDDIGTLYLAGGFGTNTDIASACDIDMIPHRLSGKAVAVGNAAAKGAAMMLTGEAMQKKASHIANFAEYVDLTQSTDFADIFTDALYFK